MKFSKTTFTIIISIVLIVAIIGILSQQHYTASKTLDENIVHSPYAGQEYRDVKALSQNDIDGLLAGTGTPFGGMAKPAELNGYPGPRHVLDAVKAGELELTNEQQEQIQALYEEMRSEAIDLGKQIIDIEREVDDAFIDETITEEFLQKKVSQSADLYGQLRFVHLKYHLFMVNSLTPQQVEKYNELRGYTFGDPCENVPEGHDLEIWKLHNNCE
ncbi:MAG: hypothetical protein CXT79_06665 [Thaumarchaeota archaeon]|jgi:Spy/CpxP family protein refolding chaperone|nr:MAG: hypothetical protein CXT79_06665 [Nitrososphaerota archaeon]